jgi:alpha-methylacyl-CoA racemase
MAGPLEHLRVVEMAGLGPGPFAAMLLADMGAEVIRVDRPPRTRDNDGTVRQGADPRRYVLHRGRRSVALDMKTPDGPETVLRLLEKADVLVEGHRPGVMERLGLGPDECCDRNERLIYARMTGWGQDGPLAHTAGHDIDYIAVAGALHNFARLGEAPVPPLSLVGDMGGGGLLLAFGILSALWERERSGRGQVIDGAMVDGAALLMSMFYGLRAQGRWDGPPGANFADTGAPYYEVYLTADDRYLAVGALEADFYRQLVERLGVDRDSLGDQRDETSWPAAKRCIAEVVRTKTRDEWCEIFDGSDACVAPVLSMGEAPSHPHNAARATFVVRDGIVQPAPAPRFSRTPPMLGMPPPVPGEHGDQVLGDWGFDAASIEALRKSGTLR